MKNLYGIFLIVLAVALIAGSQSLFTVDQREQAIVLQLGQPIGEVRQPGLHFKIPFVQDVRRFDSRILSVDPEPEQMVISSSNDSPLVKSADPNIIVPKTDTSNPEIVSGEPIIVDAFARYRINDPLMFMKTLRTVGAANQRIENIMNESTRSVLGQTTMRDLLSTERSTVMHDILNRVNKKIETDQLGVDVIDVRIVRADLTPALRQSTVQRMISELKERATETRAKGEERALEIRSTAEKERTILLADAQKESQIIRGEGDNNAIQTYTKAFNKDQEFYDFIRSLEAYRNTLANPETRLILSPNSAFFKHFQSAE
ncbi:MAG: protease modulator HflC [Alphaproteobacteria bacterium]|jgi:membrane protease subunit HflC|nr:protease modulator HflC [Alphaproteobacteria bacterium]MDP7222086.1 protease modulator HflC [Alphaproteobacteria bacterium]